MNDFSIIQLLLFTMVILTLLNGIIFFKKLIKLQQETNQLLLKILTKDKNLKKLEKNLVLIYTGIKRTAHEIAKTYANKLTTINKNYNLIYIRIP